MMGPSRTTQSGERPERDPFLQRLEQLDREGEITPDQANRQREGRAFIVRQERLFEEQRPALLERYEGKFVAFEDGVVLDFDLALEPLSLRMVRREGARLPLIKRVQQPLSPLELETYQR